MTDFNAGDRVRVRDHLDFSAQSRFGYGTVTHVDEQGPLIQPDGWEHSVRFEEVQRMLSNAPSVVSRAPARPEMNIFFTTSGPSQDFTSVTNSFEGYAPNADGHCQRLVNPPDWKTHICTSLIHPTIKAAEEKEERMELDTENMEYEQAFDYGGCLGLRDHDDWLARYEERMHHDGFRPDLRAENTEFDPFNHKNLIDSIT